MLYNDEQMALGENMENMARAYAETLKRQGFYFVKADETVNERDVLLNEIFKTINRLLKVYSLNKANGFNLLYDNLVQINDSLTQLYGISVSTQSEKNSRYILIGLESNLLLKLFSLAELDNKEEPKNLALARLELMKDLYYDNK